MAEGKQSFILYCDIIHTVKMLDDAMAGKLLKHILKFVNDENPEIDDPMIKIVFEPIKQALKRDLKKWETISENNKINGHKGGINSGIVRGKKKYKAKEPGALKSKRGEAT